MAKRTCVVVPRASEHELTPLLDYLRSEAAPPEALTFPRGTLLPDGRLDLCKQGLGPEGAHAVAAALGGNRFVRSLLLGADGLGNDGLRAVSDRLGESDTLETLFVGC